MNTVYANKSINVSAFKVAPTKAVKEAGEPLAVMVNNEPSFYAVPAEIYATIADLLDDAEMTAMVVARLAAEKPVPVNWDELENL